MNHSESELDQMDGWRIKRSSTFSSEYWTAFNRLFGAFFIANMAICLLEYFFGISLHLLTLLLFAVDGKSIQAPYPQISFELLVVTLSIPLFLILLLFFLLLNRTIRPPIHPSYFCVFVVTFSTLPLIFVTSFFSSFQQVWVEYSGTGQYLLNPMVVIGAFSFLAGLICGGVGIFFSREFQKSGEKTSMRFRMGVFTSMVLVALLAFVAWIDNRTGVLFLWLVPTFLGASSALILESKLKVSDFLHFGGR